MQGRGDPRRGPRQLSTQHRTGCVLVAAGSGSRLGVGIPKAFVNVGGHTLLEHALSRVLAADCVDEVVVVVPPEMVGSLTLAAIMQPRHPGETPPPASILQSRHLGDVRTPTVTVVAGGPSRQASVQRGLAGLSDDVTTVLVHDAARCLTPPEVIRAVATAVAQGHQVVVPVVPVADTIRQVDGGVIDRSRLRAVQTPQGFSREILERAHVDAAAHADDEALAASDDAGLVERLGAAVHLVEGSDRAFKVTNPLDLRLAVALVGDES